MINIEGTFSGFGVDVDCLRLVGPVIQLQADEMSVSCGAERSGQRNDVIVGLGQSLADLLIARAGK